MKQVPDVDAWNAGFKKGRTLYPEASLDHRRRHAVFRALLFLCRKQALTADDQEQLGMIEGLFAE